MSECSLFLNFFHSVELYNRKNKHANHNDDPLLIVSNSFPTLIYCNFLSGKMVKVKTDLWVIDLCTFDKDQ